ncbi:DUF948 domain-containing protein [Bacillus andreraoultii]|uniref:DUF948 domain-containing protein n=1 Tax=Bacillus andreraoultii TaxID=1499685 RepID=UPI00053A49DF|nr:DUF948 domain-containing protein [Bacillus andreraoultii]
MEAVLYISVAVIAIAFFILVIYIIQTLKSLTQTLNNISHTVEGLEEQLQGVTRETESLLKTTNHLAEDLSEKSKRLDSVVIAVEEVGKTVQSFNHSLTGISNKIINKIYTNEEKLSQVVGWGKIAMEFKDKWKQVRARKKQTETHIVIEKQEE